MSLISRMRKQKAVYWAQSSGADDYGQIQYAAPVEIDCRWEDSQQEFIGKDGSKRLSRAVVYVDRDMKPGDKLKLSTLAALTQDLDSGASTAPDQFSDVFEVMKADKIPNLRNTELLRVCYL